MDLNIVNKFVSIATSQTIDANSRVSLVQNGGKTQDVRTTETSVFSRLMERTFRSNQDSAINRAARQGLVNSLTSLFKVKNANYLPPAVRDAFVKGEVICDRPLTQRRVSAIMTAAVRELGFATMEDFEKRLKMKAFLDEKLGPQDNSSSEALDEKAAALLLSGDELDGDFDELIERLDKDEYDNGPTADRLGFSQEDLKAYYNNWKNNVYAVSQQRERELAEIAQFQAPEQVNLEQIFGNRKEAAVVINKANYLLSKLDIMDGNSNRNDLQIKIRTAVRSALDCIEKGDPKSSDVKNAAKFLRGLKLPPACSLHDMVSTISYKHVDDEYSKMMSGALKNIDKFLHNEKEKIKNQTNGKSIPKADLKAAEERFEIAKVRMHELIMKLNPMGDDFLDLSNSPEKVRELYDCANSISNEKLFGITSTDSLDDLREMIDADTMGDGPETKILV